MCSHKTGFVLHTQVLYSHLPPMASDLTNNMHIKFNVVLDDIKVGIPGCCPAIILFLNLIKMALGLGFGN